MLNFLKKTSAMKLPIDLNDRPLSYSSIKEFRKSPKHYVQYITEPRKPPSEAQIIGSAFEMLLLEPEKFEKDIFIYTKPNLRSNAGKEEWEQIKTQGEGKLMITEEIETKVKLMVQNAQDCPEMVMYINAITARQVRLTWKHKGFPFIGYVDAEGDLEDDWCFEIKTARSADPDDFNRDIYKWGYNMQIGAYAEGYHRSKYKFPNFAFLVFETEAPYNCAPIMVDSKQLKLMRDEWQATIQAFKFCVEEELFHQGYNFQLQTKPYFAVSKPGYYRPKFITDEF